MVDDTLILGALIGFIIIAALLKEQQTRQRKGSNWNTEHLLEADPGEFEELVRDYYDTKYEEVGSHLIKRTDQTGDRGLDVIVEVPSELRGEKDPLEQDMSDYMRSLGRSPEKIGIECKRYSPGNRVGRPTIQQTKGAAEERDCDRAVVVTSSDFTESAKESARSLDVELIDGADLCNRLSRVALSPNQMNLTTASNQRTQVSVESR